MRQLNMSSVHRRDESSSVIGNTPKQAQNGYTWVTLAAVSPRAAGLPYRKRLATINVALAKCGVSSRGQRRSISFRHMQILWSTDALLAWTVPSA
ncbi:hypothetical protein KIN20_019607 [Parelaphostrongylus tenuis]|uniref:Uncharacterized protein n=1 Tax=Parelaphostrongylus tenuis TaxID=148309 RepID=A0AAD5N510_PARTN|nr:hypothetical protein KIN20_003395 [Parelaphostrongylus tenuis]KAJ1353997.1 hypothetical protein KIN20_010791 [Parelaphostrongylus tenuis]KAJ1354003.1 hypothetical protein KIN20_010799 [Parelaphostrongylus tenuis]KAJ1354004.1 hypothetical protein KIN20_010804 [Parelaphostrongylus tenuis]KAJ1360559.1 hypothetical protein KIN20_019571 [Parelaphostrongylus tenuis]